MSYELQLKTRYAEAHRRLIHPDYSPKKVLKIIPKVDPPPPAPIAAPEVIPNLSPALEIGRIQPRYTLKMLAYWFCHLERLTFAELKSEQRPRKITVPRQMFYYLAYRHSLNRFSSAQIGRFLNKDHTTILSGVKNIETLRLKNRQLDRRLMEYEEALTVPGLIPADETEQTLCPLCPHRTAS